MKAYSKIRGQQIDKISVCFPNIEYLDIGISVSIQHFVTSLLHNKLVMDLSKYRRCIETEIPLFRYSKLGSKLIFYQFIDSNLSHYWAISLILMYVNVLKHLQKRNNFLTHWIIFISFLSVIL
jgi:hypothetical protein